MVLDLVDSKKTNSVELADAGPPMAPANGRQESAFLLVLVLIYLPPIILTWAQAADEYKIQSETPADPLATLITPLVGIVCKE